MGSSNARNSIEAAQPELFTAEDVSVVQRLEAQVNEYPWSEQSIIDSLQAGHYCYCHKESGCIVAFAVFSLVADEATLLNLAVSPKHQGRGIAKSLLTQLLLMLVRQGAFNCVLEVRASNRVAQELYYTLGFYEVGQRAGYYPCKKGSSNSGREDALILCMPLSAEALDGAHE